VKAIQILRRRKGLLSFACSSLLAATAAAAQVAGAAPGTSGIDDSGNFRSEVQACKSGETQQDRSTCLQEARNAQAARKQGALVHPHEDYQANALARCDVFKGEDKAACEARVMGYGSASGSVAGGGVLRQVETVVVPPGQEEVTIEPKTSDPVVLVPATPATGASK